MVIFQNPCQQFQQHLIFLKLQFAVFQWISPLCKVASNSHIFFKKWTVNLRENLYYKSYLENVLYCYHDMCDGLAYSYTYNLYSYSLSAVLAIQPQFNFPRLLKRFVFCCSKLHLKVHKEKQLYYCNE